MRRNLYLLFLLNSVIIFFLFLPSIKSPPRSDYWAAFYYFSKIKSIAEPGALKFLSQYHLFGHGRFQPLSHIILFYLFSIFKNHITFYNFFNISVYLLLIFCIYRLSLEFSKNYFLIFSLITAFSVLLTHFDIVCWSYHCYVIIGFIFLILGLFSFIKYLKTYNLFALFIFVLFSLGGILCYEPFSLWPLFFLFLIGIYKPSNKASIFLSLCVIYFIYGLFFKFLFLDSLNTYSYSLTKMFYFGSLIKSANCTISNIFLINIISNISPFLIFPLKTFKNVDLGGVFVDKFTPYYLSKPPLFIGTWIIFICLLILLFRKRDIKNFYFILFFVLAMLSSVFVLALTRIQTNDMLYVLSQPRYQLIPNFIICLLIIIFFEDFFSKSYRLIKILSIAFIFCIFSLNFFYL